MLYFILAALAAAALLGIWILKNWLTGGHTARGVVYAHGVFAAAGLVVLAVLFYRHPEHAYRNALWLLVTAALGGFYMFFRDLKGKFSPVWLAVVHAVLAVAGFFFLLLTLI